MKTSKTEYPSKKEIRQIFLKELKKVVLKEKNIKAQRDQAERLGLTWAGLYEAIKDDNEVGKDFLPAWFEKKIRKDAVINEMFKTWEAMETEKPSLKE